VRPCQRRETEAKRHDHDGSQQQEQIDQRERAENDQDRGMDGYADNLAVSRSCPGQLATSKRIAGSSDSKIETSSRSHCWPAPRIKVSIASSELRLAL
jgi:hypothetical protein